MIGRLAQSLQQRPRVADSLVTLFWLLVSLATIDFMGLQARGALYVVPAIVVAAAALMWRRGYPLRIVGVQTLVVVLVTLIDPASPVPVAIICGVYSVGAHYPRRTRGAQVLIIGLSLAFLVTWQVDWRYIDDSVLIMVLLFVAWIVGDSLRTRRAYRRSLIERAERAEALRDSLAHQAVTEERSRIARDLHDVVAHSMSIMVVQAGAARRVAIKHPEMAAKALEAIEDVGRGSLNEMRRILGVLRGDEPAEHAPQPGIGTIEGLVGEFSSAGLRVRLIQTGERCELPASLELTAFRIVQESLTNVLKHAGDATATVTLLCARREYHITVTNTDSGHTSRAADTGGQRGLLGMRERVASFGGRFEAGPTMGGYQVKATLPVPQAVSPPLATATAAAPATATPAVPARLPPIRPTNAKEYAS